MLLHEHSVRAGNRLFRWRSYLPLFLVPVLIAGLFESGYSKEPRAVGLIWEMFCLAVSFFGFSVRCYTTGHAFRGTSGKNTKRHKADLLNTTGPYSLMRNPLYFGNFFMMLGVALFVRVWWVSVIYGLVFWLYYERIIMAEEAFLEEKYGKDYLEYAKRTPAFIPKLNGWRRPALPFSFRHILKREYSAFFVMIASFTLLKFVGDYALYGKPTLDILWSGLLLSSLGIYLTLRILAKKTRLLRVEGR